MNDDEKTDGTERKEKDESVEKALSLFRVFDVAFFAPGGLLFVTLIRCGAPFPSLGGDATAGAALAVLAAIVEIYILGLVCHALAQAILIPLRSKMHAGSKTGWFRGLTDTRREDLALYFWYLRATCWNLAAALGLSGVILLYRCIFDHAPWGSPWIFIGGAFAVAGLMALGWDYDRAFRNAATK